ncbi:MAG: hypothetical protein C0392_13100 [Syntrophus sp. (in: bacteria)]|nr:hypothetical protein [Syntrophus sp. (in: bacteria)]
MTAAERNPINFKHIIALLLLAYIFFFHGLGGYSLKEPDEGRYAEIPREMVEMNDYVVPHLNYTRYFEKPPLFYWAVALSYKTFGVNEWSFRFPNALSAFLCVMALYFCGRRWFHEEVAFLSSVILMSSLGFFAMSRVVTLDMFLSLWLFLSLIFFYGYYQEKKPLFIYLFYGAMGFATLAKGPVGVILAGITIVIFLITEKRLSFLKELKWFQGILIYLAVTLPWLIAVSLREKEFLYFFFMDQHILRFFTSKHKRTGSLFYFLPVLFGGMLPWSLFIPRAFMTLWSKKELRLFFIWTLVIFTFFSISKSKLPPYILPVFPALSLILGSLFHEKWGSRVSKPEIIACIGFFAILSLSVFLYGNNAFVSSIGAISGEAGQILKELRGFSIALSSVSIVFILLLLFRGPNRFSSLFPVLTLFAGFVVIALLLQGDTIDRLNTTKRLSAIINRQTPVPHYLINYAALDHTMPFYTKRRVIIASYKGELEMGAKYEDAKPFFISEDDFLKLFNSDNRTVVILKEKKLKRLREILLDRMRVIDCRSERCLITNY